MNAWWTSFMFLPLFVNGKGNQNQVIHDPAATNKSHSHGYNSDFIVYTRSPVLKSFIQITEVQGEQIALRQKTNRQVKGISKWCMLASWYPILPSTLHHSTILHASKVPATNVGIQNLLFLRRPLHSQHWSCSTRQKLRTKDIAEYFLENYWMALHQLVLCWIFSGTTRYSFCRNWYSLEYFGMKAFACWSLLIA